MSHEIEVIDGRALFMGREDAWHQLGTIKGRNFGWDDIEREMPEFASPIIKRTVTVDGTHDVVDGMFAHVRRYDGKVVGFGSPRYELYQQFEAYEFGEALAKAGDLPAISCGLIRDGRQGFITFDAGTYDVGDETFHGFISVVFSHDGSMPVQVIYSTIVVVCANTMAAALGSAKHRYVLRHTRNIRDREQQIIESLGGAKDYFRAGVEAITAAQNVPVNEHAFADLVECLMPKLGTKEGRSLTIVSDAHREIGQLFRGPLTEAHPNSGWAFIQAVNTWEQWERTVKGVKGRDVADVRAERQFDAMCDGTQPLTAKAYELVLV